jgi:anti-sigma B factor antagonist
MWEFFDLEIEIKEDVDVVTIAINGNIEMATMQNFNEKLFGISHTMNKNIDIDLSNVDYIDSSGVAILIGLMKLQKKKGKKLIIKKASPKVLNVLMLSSLTDSFGM